MRARYAALVAVGLLLLAGGAFGIVSAAPSARESTETLRGGYYLSVTGVGPAGASLSGQVTVLDSGEVTVTVSFGVPCNGFRGPQDPSTLFQATGSDVTFSVMLPKDGQFFVCILGDSVSPDRQQTVRASIVRGWWGIELLLGASLPAGLGGLLVARGYLGHRRDLRRDQAAFFSSPASPPGFPPP